LIGLFAKLLEAPLAIPDVQIEPRDAIVVLGAPLGPGGRLTQILEERVAAAVQLYRAGGARYVVASGGVTHGAPRAEADALAEALRGAGIPEVVVESRSRSTVENARYTAELLAPLGVHTIWLVTQPFHGKRAELLFRRIGFEPRVWHISDSIQYRDRTRALKWLLREYGSWAALRLRGKR
jgi:uncharacterized SAM-binding protein YcdF (DUF218 family)